MAENLVLVADHNHLRLYDISTQKQLHSEERSCSTVSWSYDGSLACAANKSGEVSAGSLASGRVFFLYTVKPSFI